MDGKQKMMIVFVSGAFVLYAAAAVTADSWSSHTPLYTFRMEQVCSKMNFLPITVNGFTYIKKSTFSPTDYTNLQKRVKKLIFDRIFKKNLYFLIYY